MTKLTSIWAQYADHIQITYDAPAGDEKWRKPMDGWVQKPPPPPLPPPPPPRRPLKETDVANLPSQWPGLNKSLQTLMIQLVRNGLGKKDGKLADGGELAAVDECAARLAPGYAAVMSSQDRRPSCDPAGFWAINPPMHLAHDVAADELELSISVRPGPPPTCSGLEAAGGVAKMTSRKKLPNGDIEQPRMVDGAPKVVLTHESFAAPIELTLEGSSRRVDERPTCYAHGDRGAGTGTSHVDDMELSSSRTVVYHKLTAAPGTLLPAGTTIRVITGQSRTLLSTQIHSVGHKKAVHRTTPPDNLVAITASDPSQLTSGGNVLIACVVPPLQPAVREAMRISPASDKRPQPTKARDPSSAIGARVTAGGVSGVVFAFEERKTTLAKQHWVPYSSAGGILYRVRSDDGADAGTFALAGAAAAAALLPPDKLLAFSDAAMSAAEGRMASVHFTQPMPPSVLSALASGAKCNIQMDSMIDDTRAAIPRFAEEVAALRRDVLPALRLSTDGRHDAIVAFIKFALVGLLPLGAGGLKALRRACRGFTGLKLFPRLTFFHDTLHACINCGKRTFDWIFATTKAIDIQYNSGLHATVSFKLRNAWVPNGKPTNPDGSAKKGNLAYVLKMMRGLQWNQAIKTRVWDVFLTSPHQPIALRDAFEFACGAMYGLSWLLKIGLRRAQVFLYGVKSPANRKAAQDLASDLAGGLRATMNRMFPGDIDSVRNPAYAVNSWMMRSCLTVFLVMPSFLTGYAPMATDVMEDMQASIRAEVSADCRLRPTPHLPRAPVHHRGLPRAQPGTWFR